MTPNKSALTKRKKNLAQQQSSRMTVISVVVVALVIASGAYLYKTKDQPIDSTSMAASFKQLTDWFAANKSRLNNKIVKVQQMTAKNAEQPIHFEFYSELPKMKVPVPHQRTENT